jgi:2-keto-4-pentenoate hydratase
VQIFFIEDGEKRRQNQSRKADAMTPQLADTLIEARRTGVLLSTANTTPPETLEEVYAIQAAVAAATGAGGGFKVGRAGPPDIPTYAPIRKDWIWQDGATIPANLSRLCGVELELGFVLKQTPPAPDDPAFEAKLRACLTMAPMLEIVDCPRAHPTIRLEIDGEIAAEGRSAVPGGDAFDTVAAFARAVGNHCDRLKTGDAIITGSLEGLFYGKPGDVISGFIEDVGSVGAKFD